MVPAWGTLAPHARWPARAGAEADEGSGGGWRMLRTKAPVNANDRTRQHPSNFEATGGLSPVTPVKCTRFDTFLASSSSYNALCKTGIPLWRHANPHNLSFQCIPNNHPTCGLQRLPPFHHGRLPTLVRPPPPTSWNIAAMLAHRRRGVPPPRSRCHLARAASSLVVVPMRWTTPSPLMCGLAAAPSRRQHRCVEEGGGVAVAWLGDDCLVRRGQRRQWRLILFCACGEASYWRRRIFCMRSALRV
jgi:hypothetical protein